MKDEVWFVPHVVIFGNPVDGFFFVGPFTSHDEALRYAEKDGQHDWWVEVLQTPATDEEEGD